MFVYVWGGGGTKAAVRYMQLQNGVCCVRPEATIVKASFRSFRSIFGQNTLLKTLRTNRKCGQEGSSGK